MRRGTLARRFVLMLTLTVALGVAQTSLPVLQPSALASAALQVPGPQPAPSPAPVSGPGTAADRETAGEPGPSDTGASVQPHQLPALPRGERPEQVRQEIPRQHPVDQAEVGRQKALAHEAAAAAEHRPGGTPVSAPPPKFATLDINQTGGWNPPDGGLAVGPASVLVAVNEAFAIYDKSTNDKGTHA